MGSLKLSAVLVAAVAVVALVAAGKHDVYSSYSVHNIVLRDHSDAELLHQLEESMELDMWQHGAVGLRDAMVMVQPQDREEFLNVLDVAGIDHHVHLDDVASAFEEYDDKLASYRASKTSRAIYDGFPRHDEINEYLEELARLYPNLVTLVTAGLSYEGREIKYLRVSTTNFQDPSKPIYFMDAMIHAREWVTTPVTLYALHRLLEDRRPEDEDLLSTIDWIIWPVVNPDGYEFTHTDFRLWRRTRSLNLAVTECYGVDANRNFDASFNTIGVSANPCADTYPGSVAFSEPETRYIRDIMLEYRDRIQIYMNIHSWGNYVLYGYGSGLLPSTAFQLHHVGSAMGEAMDAYRLPQARHYLVGNSNLVLYGTSGSAQDYGAIIGIPQSFTLELPGYSYDFRVPPEYQAHINEETWRGFAVTARLARLYYAARYVAPDN